MTLDNERPTGEGRTGSGEVPEKPLGRQSTHIGDGGHSSGPRAQELCRGLREDGGQTVTQPVTL